jgi:hypothetical protein
MKGRKHHQEPRAHRASGGKTEEGVKVKDSDKGAGVYAGEDSNTLKEAREATGFKKGGKVAKKQGYYDRGHEAGGMHEFEKLKHEKKAKKDGGSCDGDKPMHRLDRPKRASGGAISGSRSPFAKAADTSERPGFKGMRNIND